MAFLGIVADYTAMLLELIAAVVLRHFLARVKKESVQNEMRCQSVLTYPRRRRRKDRDVMLGPTLLDALRVYWRGLLALGAAGA